MSFQRRVTTELANLEGELGWFYWTVTFCIVFVVATTIRGHTD